MNVDKQDHAMRHRAQKARGRRAMGMAAAGAVIVSGLGIAPAVAALPPGGPGLSPAALAGMLPAALPTKAEGGVGPIDPRNGYPYWYADSGDASKGLEPVRLELCTDAAGCPVIGVDYDPAAPLSIPENFPEESFWWSAETEVELPDGATAILVMAQEAAFSGTGDVAAGQQNAFARLRLRLEDGQPNQQYTFTHPYGVDVLTADDRGRIRFTEDVGCLQQPCGWDESSNGRIGPSFLRWDPAVEPAAPEGFIGDPNVEHRVVGSPEDTNYFEVAGPSAAGTQTARSDLFAVQGKIATMKAGVDKPGGLYRDALTVNIQASLPDVAKIVYTTDGSDPAVDADGNVVNGTEGVPGAPGTDAVAAVELAVPGSTELKYLAFDTQTKKSSEIYTETYELDATRPWISATPDAAAGALAGPQTVTLTGTTNDAAVPADVYYTTDGTTPALTAAGEPTGTTREYTEPLTIGMTTTIRAVAVDSAGTAGEVRSFPFTINNLSEVGPNGDHGFPLWLRDNGWEGQEPVQLDLCLDDPLCPVVDVLPDPTRTSSWPDNFPGEAFWFAAEAEIPVDGEDVQLTLASEAAFGADMVQDGDQVAFGRVRVRGDQVFEVGATYRITHPYGSLELTADADGTINYTEDLGALNATGDFSPLLESRIGPFLRWTEGAPAGYLGDGSTPHAVTGSPYGTNEFRIEQVTEADGDRLENPEVLGETEEFVVQGRITGATAPEAPTVVSDGRDGGVFIADQLVALTATPETAQIFFTTDGTDPTTDSTLYTEPIAITDEGTTTLKFIALNSGVASEIVTQTFTLDKTAPAVEASPAGGEVAAGDTVTLTASEDARIFYTLDGSQPTAESLAYTGPVQLSAAATLRAIAVDSAGNVSQLGTWDFTTSTGTTPGEGDGTPGDGTPGDGEQTPGETPGTDPGQTPGESPAEEPVASDPARDFTGDGKADLVTTDRSGKLWLYVGNGKGSYAPKKLMGASGWNTMTIVVGGGDNNGDGKADLVSRDRAGKLWLYPGNGQGRLGARKQVGWGWNSMTSIVSVGDLSGDGKADLVARDREGRLWLYAGKGNGNYSPKSMIGSRGWNSMTMLVGAGDTTGDGKVDLVSRDTAGKLWVYPGNGAGKLTPRKQVGWGWNGMTAMMGPGDFSGDGKNDVVARDKSGNLWLYAGKGDGNYAPKAKIGWGWNIMTQIF